MNKIVALILIFLLGSSTYYAYLSFKESSSAKPDINISYSEPLPTISTLEEHNLVNLAELNTNLCFDLKYASKDNFTGTQIYPSIAFAVLHEETAEKLQAANEEFYKLGYRIKIWDSYRPYKYQTELRTIAEKQNMKTASYIADPKYGSNHNRAASVDITLTDLEGREIDMPTDFDHFGPESSIKYTDCSKEQIENRELLGTIMEKHGFKRITAEWWHFDDTDCKEYEILDFDFNELYS